MAAAAETQFHRWGPGQGGYESYYIRAVNPGARQALWLRHTIHKRPGEPARGSVWVVLFDEPGPRATKQTFDDPGIGPYLEIAGSRIAPGIVEGEIENASYALTWESDEPPLRHLPKAWMYTAPLPKTKLESPHPAARFHGTVTVEGHTVSLDGWPGMVGHNWGATHAERWIWLHGVAFTDTENAWVDLAFGRIKIAGRTTPWVANGVFAIGDQRTRLGGITGRPQVKEDPLRLDFEVTGENKAKVTGTVDNPRAQTVVWRYADPDGSEHHTSHSSLANLHLVVHRPGQPVLKLETPHGGCYELGMRETDHGLPVLPFPDP